MGIMRSPYDRVQIKFDWFGPLSELRDDEPKEVVSRSKLDHKLRQVALPSVKVLLDGSGLLGPDPSLRWRCDRVDYRLDLHMGEVNRGVEAGHKAVDYSQYLVIVFKCLYL
ncbi:hypothetical protein Dimus_012648 [Dionaea muscipula]